MSGSSGKAGVAELASSGERLVRANGVDLCAETFGDPADPAILLVHGAAASMLWWEEAFCERLAAGGRFVIRYDHRDTGRSVSYEPGRPPYSLPDLAEDALGLLDVFGIGSAHIVGRSMGGGIAQYLAHVHPERIASLTLVSTTTGDPDLPPMTEAFLAHTRETPQPAWSDREAVVGYIVGMLRAYAGNSRHFDAAAMRAIAGRDIDRASNVASTMINHFVMALGTPPEERRGERTIPTLVIHGDSDPAFPIEHGRALARQFSGSRLLVLEETGHELPPATWDLAIPAILQHTSAKGERQAEG